MHQHVELSELSRDVWLETAEVDPAGQPELGAEREERVGQGVLSEHRRADHAGTHRTVGKASANARMKPSWPFHGDGRPTMPKVRAGPG